MARSLNIPAIVGLHDVTSKLESGVEVLLDGYHGLLVSIRASRPSANTWSLLAARNGSKPAWIISAKRPRPPRMGIISFSRPTSNCPRTCHGESSGAEGVGLYRTEFFYLNKTELPDEEEQYANYRKVASEILPQNVIIRTLDLGGDKFVGSLNCRPS